MGWQDELQPKTEEFLKEFGEKFLKSYGISLFLKVKADIEADAGGSDDRKLMYRDWDSVRRGEVMESQCYIKEGEGAGSFGGWKQFYMVEMQDYNIGLYGDAKAAASGDPKKAKNVLRMAGYTVEKNVNDYYKNQATEMAAELECDEPEVGFSDYCWALTHPLRPDYILQFHKGAGGGCPCFGGASVEPADAGAENSDKIEEWASAMDDFVGSSSPRDLEGNVVSMAFERTVQKMANSVEALDGFSDDGTEGQILAHMVFIAIFEAACKSELQEEVKKAPMGKVMVWYKGRGVAANLITKAVEKAWGAMQKKAEELTKKIEPKIRSGIEPILKKKIELQDKLKSAVGGKLGEAMGNKGKPVLNPMLNAFDKPMRKGVDLVLKIYGEAMDKNFTDQALTGELPAGACKSLDQVARTSNLVEPLHEAAAELVQPLEAVKKQAGDVLESFEPNDVRKQCQEALLLLLDAAVYSTEERMKEEGAKLADVRAKVLADAKQDGMTAIKDCVQAAAVSALMSVLNSATKDLVGPIFEQCNAIIPEDLQEILDVEAEYNMLIESVISETVGKMIEGKYK